MLKDLDFQVSYNYDRDNILEDFYIPTLKESTYYRRATGDFGPKSLARAVLGFSKFFFDNGKMDLICNVRVNEEEFMKVLENLEEHEIPKEIEKKILKSFDDFVDEVINNHIEVLAWLLKEGRLEIRFVLMKNPYYIYHKKIGILEDNDRNVVSFYGSINESIGGWDGNNESFLVFKNWEEGHSKIIKDNIEEFENDWKIGRRRHSITFSLSSAIENKILQFVKDKERTGNFIEKSYGSIEEQEIVKEEMPELYEEKGDFDPFKDVIWKKPQIQGYDEWKANNQKGILSIATGVGKTLIGIKALYDFTMKKLTEEKKPVVLIGVHSNPMINQWREEIIEWLDFPELGNKFKSIITIFGKLGVTINDQINNLNLKWRGYRNIIIIARYDIVISKIIPFLKTKTDYETLFIADEVHELGTEKRRRGLIKFNPEFRMGLSATPKRYFDKLGTSILIEYFEKIVFSYTIGQAINDKYLCEYDYKPIFCDLNDEERKKYANWSIKYAIEKEKKDSDPLELQRILERRAKIIKKAQSKFSVLVRIVNEIQKKEKRLRHILMYLEEYEQLKEIKSRLVDRDIIPGVITQNKPKKKRERIEIIEKLKRGVIPMILAIQILDQGINIPELRYAIIAASTGNVKQYIQRRGRILRTKENKEKAIIYDLIVPISETEINRAMIFLDDCSNKEEVRKIFKENGISFNKNSYSEEDM